MVPCANTKDAVALMALMAPAGPEPPVCPQGSGWGSGLCSTWLYPWHPPSPAVPSTQIGHSKTPGAEAEMSGLSRSP